MTPAPRAPSGAAGEPLVSVVVPVHDGAASIAGAVASIRRQRHRALELVVVDDGSTDDTADVLAELAADDGHPVVRVIHQPNAGPSAARNRGLAGTSGDLVAFLDADDRWPVDSVAARVATMLAHPQAPFVQGRVEHVWPDLGAGPVGDPPVHGFQVGATLFRRRVLERIGGFDEQLWYGEDIDLFVRIRNDHAPGVRIDDVTLRYHRRLADRIDGRQRHLRSLTGSVKRALDHRRARAQVVHVIDRLDRGGASTALVGAVRASLEHGDHAHRVVSLTPAAPETDDTIGDDVAVLDGPPPAALHTALADADVVHLHLWNTPRVYDLLTSELPPTRLLLQWWTGGGSAPHVLLPSLGDVADLLAVTSQGSLRLDAVEAIRRRHGDEHVTLMLPVTDLEARAPLVTDRHRSGRAFTIGYVGTVDFVKLHRDFVAMCAAVDVPGLRVIVAGGGAALDTLRREADAAGFGDRFELLGPVDDVAAVLARCDVFGYPLCADNYASAELVLFEAMHAGVPPVVLAHGPSQHTVEHGRSGIVAASTAAWVAAVQRLHADPDLRHRLGAGAHAHAAAHYGKATTLAQLHEGYDRLLAGGPRRHPPLDAPTAGGPRFAWTLGPHGDVFRRSLTARRPDEALAADAVIAESTPTMVNPGAGGIVQYRNHHRTDPHLRLWSALVLERHGRRGHALAELLAARALGLADERLEHHAHRLSTRLRGQG